MIGFDGDAECVARVQKELRAVLAAFPLYLEPGESPGWVTPDERAYYDRFDVIVRAHKKDRLSMPVAPLLETGGSYYGVKMVHARRFAWFVPSLLAGWLEAPELRFGRFDGAAFERLVTDTSIVMHPGGSGTFTASLTERPWSFAPEEIAALASFFEAALAAALATPLAEPLAKPLAKPSHEVRAPLGASRAFETVRLAGALYGGHTELAAAWAAADAPLALAHLLAAADAHAWELREVLACPPMRSWLERAFFADPERADAIAKADALLEGAI